MSPSRKPQRKRDVLAGGLHIGANDALQLGGPALRKSPSLTIPSFRGSIKTKCVHKQSSQYRNSQKHKPRFWYSSLIC